MKRPSFQFYPSDWLRDTALRSCSTGARGLWMDMICYMHEGTPYGHLKVNHKVILPANLARMVGETLEVLDGLLKELYEAGVYEMTEDGAIFSKRMVRDENLRSQRAAGGIMGGNPALISQKDNLKDNLKDNHEVTNKVKQKPTPSSSSSSSSSEIKESKDSLSAGLPTCPHQIILNLYKKHLPHLAQPRIWDGVRQTNLRSRWLQAAKPSVFSPKGYLTQDDGVVWWESFFEYIANDTKLSDGFENKGRTWRPDLVWIVNKTNFAKIIDGKYQK